MISFLIRDVAFSGQSSGLVPLSKNTTGLFGLLYQHHNDIPFILVSKRMFLFDKNDKRALNSDSTVILYKLRFYWR